MDGGKFGFKSHNLQTGETKDLFTVQNKSGFGSVSPDGGRILYASSVFSTQGYDIFLSRIDGSERRRIAGADVPATTAVWSPDGGWSSIHWLEMGSKSPSW
jgi:Tol biopolymer transport system component